jgi:hypothetical protein|tara:strand:+ start:491 stop:829 length:339 start_codon:yes stop_codon:yes gene_type:complete
MPDTPEAPKPKYDAIYVCQNAQGGPSLFTPSHGNFYTTSPQGPIHFENFLLGCIPAIMEDYDQHPLLRNEAPPGYQPQENPQEDPQENPDGKPLSAENMALLYTRMAAEKPQ